MEVREGMSSVVLTIGPGHTLRDAAAKMTERSVGAAIVIDEETPGPRIISERDILNSVGRGEDPDGERVSDHMSETVITASPDWSLERAAAEMAKRHIRHLVIVEGGQPVGVLSMRDIMRVWTSEGATSGMTPPPA
jgi:signal-transduction protein with cAMP-binding, CBS, and nucleotidyltransferase domain